MNEKIKKSNFYCIRDGMVIRGREYRPVGDGLPIAIVCHGFMANMMTVKHYAKRLAELGYAAFCFDFCGGCAAFGKSDGKTTEMSVLTEVKDLRAVIEYAKKLEYTDASRTLLMGCSQGGLVSAITAAEIPDEINKLVLFYPALCIPDDARSGKMMLLSFDPKNVPSTLQCGPMKLGRGYVLVAMGIDPYREMKNYRGDVMIVHGTADRIVDLTYSERARDLYLQESNGRLVEYRVIEGGEHMFSPKHDRTAIEHLVKFASLD